MLVLCLGYKSVWLCKMQGVYQTLFCQTYSDTRDLYECGEAAGAWHCFLVDRGHHDTTVAHMALDVSICSSGYWGGWTSRSQRSLASHKLYGAINPEYKVKHSTNLRQKIVQWLTFPSKTYYIYFKTARFRNYIGIWYKTLSLRLQNTRPRTLLAFSTHLNCDRARL